MGTIIHHDKLTKTLLVKLADINLLIFRTNYLF